MMTARCDMFPKEGFQKQGGFVGIDMLLSLRVLISIMLRVDSVEPACASHQGV